MDRLMESEFGKRFDYNEWLKWQLQSKHWKTMRYRKFNFDNEKRV